MINCDGKLLVYVSSPTLGKTRLQSISAATKRIAELLKLPFEIVTFREQFDPIYVYYKNSNEEPIPVFCDKGGEFKMNEIYRILRNMIFVLSFHPNHSGLKRVRREVMLFS